MIQNNSLICPHCGQTSPNISAVYREKEVSFSETSPSIYAKHFGMEPNQFDEIKDAIIVGILRCPACEKHTIKIFGLGHEVENNTMNFWPKSRAKVYPTYIPDSVRKDYEEACAILDLSPKASATLSRRCLQGMIRDFWGISGKKSLFDEINSIDDQVSPDVRTVLHSLRQLGNIGAHPEKDINLIVDIEPGEANQLVMFIEYLMENWYINRQKTADMLETINEINNEKQSVRKEDSNL
jgi:hypothetical protein